MGDLEKAQVLEREAQALRKEYLTYEREFEQKRFTTGSELRKFSKVNSILQQENVNICTDLLRACDPGAVFKNNRSLKKLSALVHHNTDQKMRINDFKKWIKEIDLQIKLVSESILDLSKFTVTGRQVEERVKYARKRKETLENTLHTQMVKFGYICAKNKEKRLEIDSLLNERRVFLKEWVSFVSKLNHGKKIMLDMIEQATIAYNCREDWCRKLQILRVKAHNELNTNTDKMKQLRQTYDHHLKIRDFLTTKEQKRLMLDLKLNQKKKRLALTEKIRNNVTEYKNILADIQDLSKEENVRTIGSNFARQEELNFSNFNYVLERISEMEEMNDRLGDLYEELDDKNCLHESRRHEQQNNLEQLEIKLQKETVEANEAQQEFQKTEALFDFLLQNVSALFKMFRCDKDPILKLLANRTFDVRFYNVLFCLQLLESKVYESLIFAASIDNRNKSSKTEGFVTSNVHATIFETRRKPEIYLIDAIVKATPCSLCIEHDMVGEVIDVAHKVLNRKQAQAMLKVRLALPGAKAKIHSISNCNLPQSRKIIQARYQ